MSFNPKISRITIYPVKSLNGTPVESATIGGGGCLQHDREFAIFNQEGKKIKGKNNDLIFSLRASVDFERERISFRKEGSQTWNQFHIERDQEAINQFLGQYFGFGVELRRDERGNFLDIPVLGGITLLSRGSLEAVRGWFPSIAVESLRQRFRASIEIDGVPAFWEDRLFAGEGLAVSFRLGDVHLMGHSARERCAVPGRDPLTGEILPGFAKDFARERHAALPPWSTLSSYDHYYYLATDCLVPPSEAGKTIRVGDELTILETLAFHPEDYVNGQ